MPKTRTHIALAALVAASLLPAGTASASAQGPEASVSYDNGVLHYHGTPGTDDVRIQYGDRGITVINSTGRPVSGPAPCRADGGPAVLVCALPQSTPVVADLGDGNDRFYGVVRPAWGLNTRIDGGPGNDDITGGPGADAVTAGPGHDTVTSGAGDDSIDLQDGEEDQRALCEDGDDALRVDAGGIDAERWSPDCERIEAAAARGGTLSFVDTVLEFTARPGAANDLTIAPHGGGLRISDPAGIDAGDLRDRCLPERAGDPTTWICPNLYALRTAEIDLGDGNDRLRVVAGALDDGAVTVSGGDGDDLLHGSSERDEMKGGPGDDTLLGGPGADTVDGGDGNDAIDGGTGWDVPIGGPGDDSLELRDGASKPGLVLGELAQCEDGRDSVVADRADRPFDWGRACERFVYRETDPPAAGEMQLVSRNFLVKRQRRGAPAAEVQVRCVGGPCEGKAYLFLDKQLTLHSDPSRQGFKLEAGQTGTDRFAFGTHWGGFRRHLGRGGRRRMWIVTINGDAQGRTRTRSWPVIFRGQRGLR